MDSSGLRFLIDLYDRSRQGDWRLEIVRPRNEAATMVLRATGADTALPFEPDGSP
jgi:anti-anti-sigma regulatory factor